MPVKSTSTRSPARNGTFWVNVSVWPFRTISARMRYAKSWPVGIAGVLKRRTGSFEALLRSSTYSVAPSGNFTVIVARSVAGVRLVVGVAGAGGVGGAAGTTGVLFAVSAVGVA